MFGLALALLSIPVGLMCGGMFWFNHGILIGLTAFSLSASLFAGFAACLLAALGDE